MVVITKATKEDVIKANEFLTRLIRDEKKYDLNINENFVVNNFYELFFEKENNCILIAKIDNEIVGYLYGYIIASGDAYINKVAKLDALFVDEANRGHKIGYNLIAEFKKWATDKNCKYIELKVWNSNLEAIDLYKKNGFKDKKNIMLLELE